MSINLKIGNRVLTFEQDITYDGKIGFLADLSENSDIHRICLDMGEHTEYYKLRDILLEVEVVG